MQLLAVNIMNRFVIGREFEIGFSTDDFRNRFSGTIRANEKTTDEASCAGEEQKHEAINPGLERNETVAGMLFA